nr:SufS family cysteine desulfurase [uncultured Niameybacter sp.]
MSDLRNMPLVSKDDFPILNEKIDGNSLIYLDSAATSQRPLVVTKEMNDYIAHSHANTGRSSHLLAAKASETLEGVREKVKTFIGAQESAEIIFTKSATESLNMIAFGYGLSHIEEGDEIVILISEHHANLLPWQRVAKMKKATLKYMYLNDSLQLSKEEIEEKITPKAKIVALAHVSNVLGYENPVKQVIDRAHQYGGIVVIDGTQSVPHIATDVTKMDADFLVFSSHKMLGPTGVGVLYGKKKYLEEVDPLLLGGAMVEYVQEQDVTFAPLPHRLEAGTMHVEGVVGLGAAIDYLESIGMERIEEHDKGLVAYAIRTLSKLPYVTILGEEIKDKVGVVSFNIEGVHPHDVGTILDTQGIAIRVGHHCANPLMTYLQIPACCRVSFYVYNTTKDIDLFIEGLKKVRKVMRIES